jgi:hypothetical protein
VNAAKQGIPEDGSLQAGVMRDTWEHSEAGETTGPAPQGVEVKSVTAVFTGGVLMVDVALTGPTPVGGVNLVASVTSATTSTLHGSIATLPIAAGDSSTHFQTAPGLPPGSYVVSVAVQGGVPQGASFTI